MAELVVRQMGVRDIVRLRNVRQHRVDVARPGEHESGFHELQRQVSGGLPAWTGSTVGVVAQVDGELCGYALFERDDQHYAWNVLVLGAGSDRVEATESVSLELWTAMLEFGIKEAGRYGMRRLSAMPPEDSLAQTALQRTGFVAYSRMFVLRGELEASEGRHHRLREQHQSDIWSIHQIYIHSTPRPVQFAEARTSDWWDTRSAGPFPRSATKEIGFVLDAPDGIDFYCRITRHAVPVATFMIEPDVEENALDLVREAVTSANLDGRLIEVVVAAYQQEHLADFLGAGLRLEDERVAMVCHTTVHRVVHPVFGEPASEAARGSRVRGVPTLVRTRVREQ